MRRRCWTGIEWLVLRCGKFVMKRPLSDLRHARKEEDMASKPRARHRGSGRIVGKPQVMTRSGLLESLLVAP
jgi:hypothetical protein